MEPESFFESKATTLKVHYRTYVKKESTSTRHVFMFPGLGEHCNKFSYQVLAEMLTGESSVLFFWRNMQLLLTHLHPRYWCGLPRHGHAGPRAL